MPEKQEHPNNLSGKYFRKASLYYPWLYAAFSSNLMLRNVKRNLVFVRANANLIYYIGLIIEFNGILQAILNEFAPVTNPRQTYMIYVLIGVFIIFIGYLFQIGIRMKEEQELTI